jgi:catechol 2,3-dioxygenase-like lactoylglutathione lyase family enzyme
MTQVRRLDHLGIVVDDLEAATHFFLDLGLRREAASSVQGEWVDSIIGLKDVHTDVVFVRTPDGAGKVELIKFHRAADQYGPDVAAANRMGLRHVAFVVDDVNATVDRLRRKGVIIVELIEPIGALVAEENS